MKELRMLIILIVILGMLVTIFEINKETARVAERKDVNQQWVQELDRRNLIDVNKYGGFNWK